MQAALKVINDALQKSNQTSTNLRNANKIVQMEWFRVSSTETAQPLDVEDYLDFFEEYSTSLLKYVVNLSDANVRRRIKFDDFFFINFYQNIFFPI